MTEMPSGRPSEPRTGPAAPAPAHGDGPTRPSTPTGRTEPRGCPFGFRHYNCDCEPLEATVPEPADLRERIAEALNEWTLNAAGASRTSPPVHPRTLENLRVNSLARADAVLPVVEDAIAQYRMQVDDPDSLLHALDQARDAIAHERRGRLAAEAAVRRGRATLNSAKRCQDSLDPSERMQCAMCGGDHLAEALEALDAEQPKEGP